MRNPNGYGSVVKMTGNRRKPYACRKIVGWKEDGKPIIKYISYHRTKREAEKALAAYNEDPYRLSDLTLAEMYEEWFKRQDDKSENTRRNYRSSWKKLEPIGDIKIQNLDRFELQQFFDNGDFSRDSLKMTRNLLKMIIEYAVQRGILPISALNLHKAIEYRINKETRFNPHKVIKQEDIQKLWDNKEDEIARIILVYIYTGLRYVELFNLEPEDAHDNYIEIKNAKTEAGNRIVPLSDKVISLLPIETVPSHTTFITHFKRLLPNHVPHDTRHTFISLMAEAGIDDRIIKAIVGHKTKDITERYTHISLETMLEAVNKI